MSELVENLDTIPSEELEEAVDETVETEDLEATPEAVEGEITETEQKQVDLVAELQRSGSIPKGVEPFMDDNGKLKFVMPIDGKKYVVTFDQVLSGFNLNQAGERKLRQGKEIEKQFDKVLKDLSADHPEGKENLKKFIRKLGHDLGEVGETFLSEMIEESQIPEEERKLIERERALIEREEAIKAKEQEEKDKAENAKIIERQQTYTNEVLGVLKEKKLDDIDDGMKRKLLYDVFGRMKEAVAAGYKITATEAYEDVLTNYEMLLETLPKLYGKEHLKRRLPSEFRKMVMNLSLDDTAPPVSSSVHGGEVELEDYQVEALKNKKPKPKKKIPLSEW